MPRSQRDAKGSGPKRDARRPTGIVYAIAAEGVEAVKIGFTQESARARKASMQTGCPLRLEVLASWPGTQRDEAIMHDYLTVGLRRELPELPMHEWFRLPFSHEFVRATSGLPAHLIAEAILREVMEEIGGPAAYVERRRLLGSRGA